MTLSEYLDSHTLTLTAFAERVGVSVEAVRRYTDGDRLPRPDVMARIVEATAGAVQPGDFYPALAAGGVGRPVAPGPDQAGFSVEERLRLFDLATDRQRRRQDSAVPAPGAPDRGWTRQDLYGHAGAD